MSCKVKQLINIDSKNLLDYTYIDTNLYDSEQEKTFRIRLEFDKDYIDNFMYETVYRNNIILFVLFLFSYILAYIFIYKTLSYPLQNIIYKLQNKQVENYEQKFFIKELNVLLCQFKENLFTIQDEQERFELAMLGTKDGLWDWNPISNTVFFSDNWKKMLGYNPDEISNDISEWSSRIHPDELEDVMAKVQAHLNGETEFYESIHRVLCKNQEYKYILDRGKALFDADGKAKRVVGFHTDLSKLRKTEDELKRYTDIVNTNVIISQTDLKGVITYVSDAFIKISEYSKEELIGKSHSIIKHPDMTFSIFKDLWKTIKNNHIWKGEIKNLSKNKKTYWVDAVVSPLYDNNKNKIGYMAVRHDITSKKIIEQISITDSLTKLYNRRHFDEILQHELKRAKRTKLSLSFLMLDIDFFKQYNDTYGHQEGDKVLSSIGSVMNKFSRREGDYAFRLGGEEFGFIFHEDSFEKAYDFAEKLRVAIQDLKIPHSKSSVNDFVSVSVGLIHIDKIKEINIDSIYKQADDELYKAKTAGKNQTSYIKI
jgi:diguanylate cyclase (GGDEF)-like protein/PAS domain S-box-containing protein